MFPEWPRKGNREEGWRVHNLHVEIATAAPACVAPIGLAWQESINRFPLLDLHDSDGNHSNPNGALLTAYVLYEVITGKLAVELPANDSFPVSRDNQMLLSEVASYVVEQQQPCQYLE